MAREVSLIEQQSILPGVLTYFKSARRLGIKLGVASSSSCHWVMGHLKRLGLVAYFDCIRASDDVRRVKPDPELYLAVLDALKVKAVDAIAFEDSPNGILSAKRAGIYCVAVPNSLTKQLPLNQADLQLYSLEDLSLEKLLQRVQAS
jgi:HAD superfamily hydrolase (TIGR01509 family)